MKIYNIAVAALLASATSAYAVGLDRSGQRIGVLFETGNHVELSFGYSDPSVDGAALPSLGGAEIGNVAESFFIWSLGLKYELNDRWSFAVIGDEPYGSDVLYPGSGASTVLGGTSAVVDSYALTALARYKFNDNFSVHGGLRYQEVSAAVNLGGLAFAAAGANGYQSVFGSDGDIGYVIGAAYEIPEIALRVAVTYNSSTTHDLPTTEAIAGFGQISLPGATTPVDTPESVNIAFQTGIAEDTLLFGNIRYASYGDVVVSPAGFGRPLTDLEDGYDFEIGLGRRFNEQWSGTIAAGFSTVGEDDLVSPLAPTNGSSHIALGVKYDVSEAFAISGGVRYTVLGDAFAAPGGSTPVARFEDNDAVSIGLRLAYKF